MKGALIIEIIVAVAIVALLAAFALPAYNTWRAQNEISVALYNSIDAIRRAQTLSEMTQDDSSWGVKFQTGQITIFKGSSYVARDASRDENISQSSLVVYSGLTEIVFNKMSGFTSNTGLTTITRINDSRHIVINANGTLEY